MAGVVVEGGGDAATTSRRHFSQQAGLKAALDTAAWMRQLCGNLCVCGGGVFGQ